MRGPAAVLESAGNFVADHDDSVDLSASTCSQEFRERQRVLGLPENAVEKFQIRTPTTTRTIQNSKLLRVEFNLGLLTALISRVSRLARACDPKISATESADDPHDAVPASTTRGSESRISLGILRSTRKSCSFLRAPNPGAEPIPAPPRSNCQRQHQGSAATRPAAPGPVPPGPQRPAALGRNRPSLFIERDLTRNRHGNRKEFASPVLLARCRRSEHDRRLPGEPPADPAGSTASRSGALRKSSKRSHGRIR